VTSSAPLTPGCNTCLIALLVIGSILLLGSSFFICYFARSRLLALLVVSFTFGNSSRQKKQWVDSGSGSRPNV